jgi:polyhydroxybutyrate depolymerase
MLRQTARWFSFLLLIAFTGVWATTHAQDTASPACTPAKPARAGEIVSSLPSGELNRPFIVFIPSGYDGTTPLPLVFSMHGFASNPRQHMGFARWEVLGEQENFISVYPQGTGVPLRWNGGGMQQNNNAFFSADDVQFFSDLLDNLLATYCIDPARVYATGFSNGGGMSNRLACELSDRIAAIGTMGGAYSPLLACQPTRPVPVISMHGMEDPIVPYEGGQTTPVALPPIEEWAAEWAARNGCRTNSVMPDPTIPRVVVHQWTDCEEDASVILYAVEDGGHTWSGGLVLPEFIVGLTRIDFDATPILWDFLRQHHLSSVGDA